jgi:hypothetical protein
MLQKVIERRDGSCGRAIRGGFLGGQDAAAVFAYEAWRDDLENPAALEDRLDRLAFGYVVGVAVAWPGIPKTAPAAIRRTRTDISKLEPEAQRCSGSAMSSSWITTTYPTESASSPR